MVSATHSDRRLTYDDFLLFPEGDGLRHEIIDGVRYVTGMNESRRISSIAEEYANIGWSIPIATNSSSIFVKQTDFMHAHRSLPQTAPY